MVVLLLRPEAVIGASFQLSFAAVLALMVVFEAWQRRTPDQDKAAPGGSVRRVLQKPAVAGGHGMLVMFDVTDPGKVARHDREGCYERNR